MKKFHLNNNNKNVDIKLSRTLNAINNNKSEINIVRGVPGSGKTMGCLSILFFIAANQAPASNGVRYARFCIIRDTYPNLDESVIKTFKTWFPDFKITKEYPRRSNAIFRLNDNTICNIEFTFLAIHDEDYQKKLDSKEYTCFFLNELSCLNKGILDMCQERLGRYPTEQLGGITYSGILCDTNTKNQSNWIYDLEMYGQHDKLKFWVQPAPLLELIKHDGSIVYKKNPLAENIENLANLPKIPGKIYTKQEIINAGYNYYIRLIPGKTQDYIDERILNRYSPLRYGTPVYGDIFDEKCIIEKIEPSKKHVVICGFDTSGFNPAVIFVQLIEKKVFVLAELIIEDIAFEIFIKDILIKFIKENFDRFVLKFILDPSNPRDAMRGITPMTLLKKEKFPCELALTNKISTRINTSVKYIRNTEKFFVSKKCYNFIEGLQGKYRRKIYKTSMGLVASDDILKDENCHIQDAFHYAIMKVDQEYSRLEKMEKNKSKINYNNHHKRIALYK